MALSIIILAAGQGKRMVSALPKVLHPIAGQSLLAHVLAAVAPLGASQTLVVRGAEHGAVVDAAAPYPTVVQDPPRGTGHAVQVAAAALGRLTAGTLLVIYGDTPLLTSATLRRLVAAREQAGAALAVLGFGPPDPTGYGRFVLNPAGQLEAIVEHADATPAQRAINLCNAGIMAIDAAKAADLLAALQPHNAQQELYLTDLVAIARARGLDCVYAEAPTAEVQGINNRAELAAAEAVLQTRLRVQAMAAGVSLVAPETVFLATDTQLAADVIIEPNVFFGPGVKVGAGARIRAFSYLEGAVVAPGAVIGPFARLRPGTEIGPQAHIGNFVEIKNSQIGAAAKVNHHSYIGDAEIGAASNIGAGTITCNYDGVNKYRTVIGEQVFVGSNNTLVAPVTIGAGAYLAAGSTITDDVPAEALSFGRARQTNKEQLGAKLRARLKGQKES